MNYWPVKIVHSFSCECRRQVLGLEGSLSDHFSVTQQSFFWRGGKTNVPEYLHSSTNIRPLIEKYFGKSKNEKRLCRVSIDIAILIEKNLIHLSISGMFNCPRAVVPVVIKAWYANAMKRAVITLSQWLYRWYRKSTEPKKKHFNSFSLGVVSVKVNLMILGSSLSKINRSGLIMVTNIRWLF